MNQDTPSRHYFSALGGTPEPGALVTDRAIFTEAFALIPRASHRDGVASRLPLWKDTRLWIIARPLSGFAETFSQYLMEVAPGGGSSSPEPDPLVEGALFVVSGGVTINADGKQFELTAGSFAFIPPTMAWLIFNTGDTTASFHWIRKRYVPVKGLDMPELIVSSDQASEPRVGQQSGINFIDPEDLRYDMHVSIVSVGPGGMIPFVETHVMEHGLYVLQGHGLYHLNRKWVEVQEGDFMWLRAFCPQTCIGAGDETFRYLLYKDVNRHVPFLF